MIAQQGYASALPADSGTFDFNPPNPSMLDSLHLLLGHECCPCRCSSVSKYGREIL
jgi:hypothetical protein